MTGCRDMDKKHQKCSKNGVFPPFATPQDFFQNSGSVTFVPLCGALTSYKVSEKSLERFPRYSKTDQPTDQLTDGLLLRTPLGKPELQKGKDRVAGVTSCKQDR